MIQYVIQKRKGPNMISIRLDTSLESELNFFSDHMHLSKSQIIKDSLMLYFEMLKKETAQKTPYELGSELFGKYASGRSDLSSIYKEKLKEKLHAKNNH